MMIFNILKRAVIEVMVVKDLNVGYYEDVKDYDDNKMIIESHEFIQVDPTNDIILKEGLRGILRSQPHNHNYELVINHEGGIMKVDLSFDDEKDMDELVSLIDVKGPNPYKF